MNKIPKKAKRLFLLFVFVVILIHFFKDITQDLLKVPTVLDNLGDVKEDLSSLPLLIQNLVDGLGYLSFITEAFLLIAIPLSLKNNQNSKLKVTILVSIIFLMTYFVFITFLDPRYNLQNLF